MATNAEWVFAAEHPPRARAHVGNMPAGRSNASTRVTSAPPQTLAALPFVEIEKIEHESRAIAKSTVLPMCRSKIGRSSSSSK
jgi:hypothetical protein